VGAPSVIFALVARSFSLLAMVARYFGLALVARSFGLVALVARSFGSLGSGSFPHPHGTICFGSALLQSLGSGYALLLWLGCVQLIARFFGLLALIACSFSSALSN